MVLQSQPSSNEDEFSRDSAATTRAAGGAVTTYAMTFQPPDWIVYPSEASSAVRFDVMRASKTCGVCELGKKLMSIFGREQDGSDFVLANPSISRKHAAIVHCAKGGVYLVDLMSRHGTFVGKSKIPPHDPTLLHEGDIVTFGQSCRTYVLKGVDPKGLSQAPKRTWRRLSLPSFFAKDGSSTKKSPPAPKKCSDMTVKLVQTICSRRLTDDGIKEFTIQVSELDDEHVEEVAYLLVEKVRVNSSNAHRVVLALLEDHIGLDAFEDNLSTIVQVSQNNLNARKILQVIAEARLESGPHKNSVDSEDDDDEPEGERGGYAPPGAAVEEEVPYEPPVIPYVPPVAAIQPATAQQQRERVLSNEGKRLFVSAIEATSVEYQEDSEEEKEDEPAQSSGFNFIESTADSAPSAFGFLSTSGGHDAEELQADEEVVEDDAVALDVPSGFLTSPSMDPQDFENLWQSASASEEWAVDTVPSFHTDLMELCVTYLPHVKILASGRVGGVHKFYYYAEQASNGTIFMVEIQVIESVGEMSATFKWIELGLLYDDGHLLFIKLFKECLAPCYEVNHPRLAALLRRSSAATTAPLSAAAVVEESPSFVASLLPYPGLDPASFEALYLGAIPISELEDPDGRELIGMDSVIAQFQSKHLFCLASGSMESMDKFFFYAELVHVKWLFFVELSISRPDGAISALLKVHAPSASEREIEQISPHFVTLVEELLADIE
ncbi:hypothetical protein, variant 1 [Aphanomyces invadans]|uniref:FHA domain-containing protein n=1 Tax=Aphanomyces invadans TaxID=157072 RepID=A0A024U552_9STRA|nr:hypothetical protein H310_07297 [Aphanomyces invadans]XP_008870888.1 hypothetical protein, variant 1 [Aphanomyces invadans]ETW00752.1 hypothetical protein H310_07297 [Aphanomyces invadans]ETW00753.1 hypothetical protein, variant 1 [Aphanomyces invadans]|eukprot:XP_008870887.1 hypothetical protein H310_07297 [Aphanomyces invadans]